MPSRRSQEACWIAGALWVPFFGAVLLGCGEEEASEAGLPTLAEVAPNAASARGGEEITLRGTGFQAGATVRFGQVDALSVEVRSSGEAVVLAPPLTAGSLDVRLDNPDGSWALRSAGFEALALELLFVEAPPFDWTLAEGSSATSAAAGDFDGDGDIDLAVGVSGEASMLVLNDGQGNLSLPEDERLPSWAHDTRALLAVDVEGDGDLDLYGGNGGGQRDRLFRNDGAGLFEDATADLLPVVADDTTSVAAGDLNGDGLVDLVVANTTPGDGVPVRVYWNVPAGGGLMAFELAAEGFVPTADWLVRDVALADVDGDGALDVVLATQPAAGGRVMRLLLRDGSELGALVEAPLPELPEPVRRLAVGDVDGDGHVDLVAICGPGQDRLLLGDGSGHFFDDTAGAMPFDQSPGRGAALVDLDRDAALDLVVANTGVQSRLYRNDGAGRLLDLTAVLPLAASPTVATLVVDVDGDADQDIVLIDAAALPLRLLLSVEPSPYDDDHP